jgi:hypothetical protein
MIKWCKSNSTAEKRLMREIPEVKISKAPGYLILEGPDEAFQKMYDLGIYASTVCFNPQNEACNKWLEKGRKELDKKENDSLIQCLKSEFPQMETTLPVDELTIVMVVLPLNTKAEELSSTKGIIVQTSIKSKNLLIQYPKIEWEKNEDSFNFRTLARLDGSLEWVATGYKKPEFKVRNVPKTFDDFNNLCNTINENRWDGWEYLGPKFERGITTRELIIDQNRQIEDENGKIRIENEDRIKKGLKPKALKPLKQIPPFKKATKQEEDREILKTAILRENQKIMDENEDRRAAGLTPLLLKSIPDEDQRSEKLEKKLSSIFDPEKELQVEVSK